jgi:hypothetical protein
MKNLWIFSIIICLPIVSAIDVGDIDVVLSQNSIKYTIHPDIGVENIELVTNGILINEKDRLVTIIQGGSFEVEILSWEEGNHTLALSSSVPQAISFRWTIDGKKQYLKDDVGLNIDTYHIENDTIVELISESSEDERLVSTNMVKKSWLKRTTFFFVDEDEDVTTFSNGHILLALSLIIIILVVILRVKK